MSNLSKWLRKKEKLPAISIGAIVCKMLIKKSCSVATVPRKTALIDSDALPAYLSQPKERAAYPGQFVKCCLNAIRVNSL